MAKHHFLPGETLTRLEPTDMGLLYTSLQRLEFGDPLAICTDREETCVAVIEGELRYRCGDQSGSAALCDMLYIPAGDRVELYGDNTVAIRYGAPCAPRPGRAFAHIAFRDTDADDRHKVYGKVEDGTRRDVWNMIDERFDSERFLMGICFGAPGGWTAWPPHEHASKREEVYIYFNMGDGFALQCVYEDMDRPDAVALVRDGHLIAIPAGYHPNVGCPKTGIRYIYCMVSTAAGDREFMDLNTQSIFGDTLE